jgi:FAD:protein FMN transferase
MLLGIQFKKINMKRHVIILSLVFIALFAFKSADHSTHYKIYTSSFENVLGTSLDMKFSALDEETADKAETAAINEIKRLNSLLSSYEENSAFSKWSKTIDQQIKIPEELKEVLQSFEKWSALTNGKLSPAIGALDRVWKDAALHQELPSEEIIEEAIKQTNQQHWILQANENTATHLSTTPLLLNTFVKSYIINKAVDKVMQIEGMNGVLINIGGDMVAKGVLDEKVSIVNPIKKSDNFFESNRIELKNAAVATSGNYKRGYLIQGKQYSHIINPLTGMPADEIQSATVVAKDAVVAGALATSFNVMSVEESQSLARKFSDVEYQIITSNNTVIESDGWEKLIVHEAPIIKNNTVVNHSKEKLWNSSYEATVYIELARLEGFARRPFVAIWIVNSNNETVKNIALWFNKPRWLPDLREWYHQNYQNYSTLQQGVFSISSATRPAGTYTFKWDGKDDKGELVKQGKYTVYIEAAREHGTYQLMKQEFTANEKEQTYTLNGNTEVASAGVAYKKIQ